MPAFEPYLMNRKQGCFRGSIPQEPNRTPRHTPECTSDKYTDYFRGRWNILRQDVCQKCPPEALCPIKPKCTVGGQDVYGPDSNLASHDGGVESCTGICIPYNMFQKGRTHYDNTYDYRWKTHNHVDDCCKAECPCPDKPPLDADAQRNMVCKKRPPLEPLDSCTTYKHFYTKKPTQCPPRRFMPDPYDPCECPLESATSYRIDYEPKSPEPQGDVLAKIIKRGMWSVDQLCKEFRDDTENRYEYWPKCGRRRPPFIPRGNLKTGQGHVDGTSETIGQFGRKCFEDRPPYPNWIHNDTWLPPETALERCTTYKHFYKPYPIRPYPGYEAITSPDAIPFSSINNVWYTCCDPPVDQRVPVELKNNDPWPRVKTHPIKYQDNLKTDPCAPFRDDTTYKADYYAKKRCAPNKKYGPCVGYTAPMLPFNDTTTNRVSYVAYPPNMIKDAKQDSGNPRGIKWGPYKCPPEDDKCRPRFPPPYGDPLKPYTGQCPCGQFDDRSMYYNDFKFWTPEMVDLVNEEHCKGIGDMGVPRGLSLYRADFAGGGGKKAEIMPPPVSKGGRCMRPCPYHNLESLYMLKYKNFWNELPRERVENYRGKPTIKNRRPKDNEADCEPKDDITFFQMPQGTTVEETLKFLQNEKEQRNRK